MLTAAGASPARRALVLDQKQTPFDVPGHAVSRKKRQPSPSNSLLVSQI